MSVEQFAGIVKPFIADVLSQNIPESSEIQKEISFITKMIPTKNGKDEFLKNATNTVIEELMKYVPQPFSVGLFDGIKTQINSQGIKFKTSFSLPPITPHIEFKILVNESQTFTGKMKFMISTEVTPISFEVQPTSEKKFTSYGKLKVSFSLLLIQSVTLGFTYDTPQFLWGKSFEIDFSKYNIEF
ncbi:hypothetical protein [Candidatus Nitrosarchaeum limnium]|jgi:hypothetical protein|uniref:Uncharacterized protein n=1 Tax=Candidatus Nitrosarchaeum limnium BG20 TaxID=859192 RepID=S2EWA7_9ARCH|nr:hypothetical protein [Candidatus Nitrosarchaeum limnium]EPA06509.1 hypothetical protein BG20_I2364 [Candidatus Nitrosarchaeum limnium BG20]